MTLRPICRFVLVSAALLVPGVVLAASANTDTNTTPTAPTTTTVPKGTVAAPAPTTPARPDDRAGYDPAGRRDPFVSLLARGDTKMPTGGRLAGAKGLLINEVSVRGVLRTNGKLMALVQAPDNKTYTIHPGDSLYDGTVKVVATDAVIFLQRVDDPLSPVKQREIRKTLRTIEETR